MGESPGETEARARDTVRRKVWKRPGVFRRQPVAREVDGVYFHFPEHAFFFAGTKRRDDGCGRGGDAVPRRARGMFARARTRVRRGRAFTPRRSTRATRR